MLFDWIKRKLIEQGLQDTGFFLNLLRKHAYLISNNDSERVHELALDILAKNEDIIERISHKFRFPSLYVDLKGSHVIPFGNAAGFDKDGDALYPLSLLFGFIVQGTVVVPELYGKDKPRVAVDNKNFNIYNALGFPSKGLEYCLNNAKSYKTRNSKTPLYISVCGIPPQPNKLDIAFKELEMLIKEFNPYADGFILNFFSPNTEALLRLRTPTIYKESAELISQIAGEKLRLAKMGPYEDNEKENWLNLVSAWKDGGGNGIVAVNTYKVPKEEVMIKTGIKKFSPEFAGISGRFLQPYRQRAIIDTRRNFPDLIILATGGIDSGQQAWSALEAGANALKGLSPYTFYGIGLILEMACHIKNKLKSHGYETLSEYQEKNLEGILIRQ